MIKSKKIFVTLLSLMFSVNLMIHAQKLQITECPQNPACNSAPAVGSCNPVPVDFGIVESGLTRKKTVTIKNSDALNNGLEVTITITGSTSANWKLVDTDGTDDGVIHFSAALGNTLNANQTKIIEIIFKPALSAAAGSMPAVLRINSPNSDPCYPDVDTSSPGLDVELDLIGTAKRTPISFAMVLDKSGSMDQIVTGSTKRIDLLKTASKYFVDLLVARNNTNDKLAAIAYSTTAITPPLISKGPLDPTSARSAIDGLSALGSTATGAGLEAANTEVGVAPAGGKNVTILFTDGEENIGPPWMTGANTANSSQVFTIGMGSLVTSSFQVALSNYAVAKNGTYYYVPETTVYSSSALPIDLQKAYLSVFTDASGMQGVVDPVYQVQLDGTEKLVGSAWITSSDHKILFSAFNEPTRGQAYDLEIRSPKGTVLANGVFGAAMEGKIIAGEGYFIYTADFSNVTDETEFVGKWDLYLKPKEKVSEKKEIVNIGFAATSFSDLQLQIGLGSTNYTPGNALNIALDFTEAGLSITNIKELFVKLTTPSGNQIILKPVPDSFGKLVTSYPHTYEAGTYQLFVRATITNSKGQVTTREQTKYYAFGYPPTVNSNPPCLSCTWIKIIIGIAILLLLLILILALRKKK